jgi:hypothetical protein
VTSSSPVAEGEFQQPKATDTQAPHPSPTGRQHDRVFNIGMAMAILAIAFVAFTTAFLRTDFGLKMRVPWVQAHAVTFVGWLLLFFAQTVLVASRLLHVHRRLGIAAAVLASVMALLAVVSAVDSFRTSGVSLGFASFLLFAVPHVDMIIFAPLVMAAIVYRSQPEAHKRLMLLATISLLDAVTSRLPMLWRLGPQGHVAVHFLVQDLFVLIAVAYDLVARGRVHPVNVWGGLAILILPPASEPAWYFLKALVQARAQYS